MPAVYPSVLPNANPGVLGTNTPGTNTPSGKIEQQQGNDIHIEGTFAVVALD
jgi:hypothetical protein